MINEAAYVYYEGLASAEGIDEIMKLGMAHPMGPLMLADLIGIDTMLCGHQGPARRIWRFQVSPLPHLATNGRRRLSRSQERARVL